MADNDVDSGQASGTPGTPTPEPSAGQNQNNSVDAATLKAAIDNLAKRLDEVDNRARTVQGEKDKTLRQQGDEVKELKRKLAEIEKLKKTGLDEDGAIDELTFRDEIRNVRAQLAQLNPAQAQPAGNGNGLSVDPAQVIKEYELDGNDPEVIAQVLSKASQLEMENAALKLAYRRSKPTTPSPAASSAVTGNPAVPEDQDAKIEKLAQLQKEPTKNRAAIKKLTEELGW